jgi:hypothetical protein
MRSKQQEFLLERVGKRIIWLTDIEDGAAIIPEGLTELDGIETGVVVQFTQLDVFRFFPELRVDDVLEGVLGNFAHLGGDQK